MSLTVYLAKLPVGRSHPVKVPDLAVIEQLSSSEIATRITKIAFKDNQRSTKEAALYWRGRSIEIEVNFCLNGAHSRLLAPSNKRHISFVSRLGGKVHHDRKLVEWTPPTATRYVYFLIAHELAQVLYIQERELDLGDFNSSPREEKWCDDYALRGVTKLIEAGAL